MPTLRLLDAAEIDARQWDACIALAPNGTPYACFHYLNAMADRWCALVMDDYRLVMPLPFKRKWGIRYVYRPPFIQRLGIFQVNERCSEVLKKACFEKALQHFSYLHYSVDAETAIELPHMQAFAEPNYVLDLQKPYASIRSQYHPSLIRSLKRAETSGLMLQEGSLPEAIRFCYARYHRQIPELADKDLQRLLHAAQHDRCYQINCHRVVNQHEELLAVAVWLHDSQRMIAILNGCNETGRTLRAMHFLFDRVIRQYSNTPLVLDFEGSSLPGVARFIRNFGASLENYVTLHANRLPFPLRWIKR
ncbi:MAG: hypothetical protein IMW88_01560 [Thermoflavifilum sp.]|uniref:hypothetical protein n=1 Tax=Thermoflavifilum sp. TaxID=1968839 RepID=UPI0018A46F33|nr:hypothetical protein [Thermoflavifilum sp.]QOR76287.1 MAG: hypothetical protein IMW88_01560 [Thermoflavifilum sp.]